MNITFESFMMFMLRSFTEPRAVVRELMDLNIPHTMRWPMLILVIVLSTIVSGILNLLIPDETPLGALLSQPFLSGFITFAVLVITVFMLHWCGRMFGGQGTLSDMILAMAWFQGVFFIAQIILMFIMAALPGIAAMLVVALFIAAIYMSAAFVDTVHEFNNLLKSFGVIVFTLVAVGFGLAVILSIIGVAAVIPQTGSLN